MIAFALSRNVKRESRQTVQFLATFVLQIALSLLGSLVVAWFSRWREYRADAGGARLAGREKMVAALQSLQRRFQPVDSKPAYATLKIAGGPGLMNLFASHPPLSARIAALQSGS